MGYNKYHNKKTEKYNRVWDSEMELDFYENQCFFYFSFDTVSLGSTGCYALSKKAMQTITFEGYEYEYTFACGDAAE